MNIQQVGIQLYTLRDHLKTPTDVAATLKRVRAIGYRTVQVSGTSCDYTELKSILDGEGLTCCGTHTSGTDLLESPGKVVERLRRLDCRLTAFPHPGGMPIGTLEEVKALAARLNAAGKVLHGEGMTLCYHNHHVEFKRVAGKPVLQIIYEETDQRYLQAELDTYWVQYGGGCPVAWCRRMRGRMPLIHLKDYMLTPEDEVTFAEIGNGNLDWPGIVTAAEESGCTWFVVEQDTCPGDPFESVRQSFEFIRDNLCDAEGSADRPNPS